MSGANVFNRLSFNFDTSKFGDAVNLSDSTKEFLSENPLPLKTWQKEELENVNILATNYYKNPVIQILTAYKESVNTFINLANSIASFDNTQFTSANLKIFSTNLKEQINLFSSHTNNVSGVGTSTALVVENATEAEDYPDYQKAINTGQGLVMILSSTDGILNATPVLGSMTSLFVNSELSANSNSINSFITILTGTIRTETLSGENGSYSANVSNITATSANTILTGLSSANTFLYTRRMHDWNFYRQSLKLLEDYDKVDRLENVGGTQDYLIRNLVGTQSYIDKLSANN